MSAFIYSQRRCFWYACQRVARAKAQGIFSCALPLFNFDELGEEEEKEVPAILYLSAVALLVFMPSDREGEYGAHLFFFSFARSILMNWGGVGERGASRSYSQRWCF